MSSSSDPEGQHGVEVLFGLVFFVWVGLVLLFWGFFSLVACVTAIWLPDGCL